MLEGININLRVMEPEDISLVNEWLNNIEFQGRYTPLIQRSKEEMEKRYSEKSNEDQKFIIEKKDRTKIGLISFFTIKGGPYNILEIGYMIIPSERKKGYCIEAIEILVDFIFLSKDIERIQAAANPRNIASLRVLEKVGFIKEGVLRKIIFMKGHLTDLSLYSILREEWKEPKILKF